MTHVAEANDYRLATEGAVDVAAPSPDDVLWMRLAALGRVKLAEVLALRDELDEVFEKAGLAGPFEEDGLGGLHDATVREH